MERDNVAVLYKKYELTEDDVFNHKHYLIITRQGIDKIQAKEKIFIDYEAVTTTPEFCVVKASAQKDDAKIQTFGSAKYGAKEWIEKTDNKKGYWLEHGNTTTWYVMEMAEKRAMSRAVLKLTGFYELGVFGEDESEDFKRNNKTKDVEIIETKKELLPTDTANWTKIKQALLNGFKMEQILTKWIISNENQKQLQDEISE